MHQVGKIKDYLYIRIHGEQNLKKNEDILFLGQYTDHEIPISVKAVDPGKIVQTLCSVFFLFCFADRASLVLNQPSLNLRTGRPPTECDDTICCIIYNFDLLMMST